MRKDSFAGCEESGNTGLVAIREVLFRRMLDVIEEDIVPLTREGVRQGHKFFGAAVLRADDLSLVLAGTNHEAECPLWHGEVWTIKEFFAPFGTERRALLSRPRPEDCLFLSTHEPCSMCLSALAWSGFPKVYFLFGYENTEEDFQIPHDRRILEEMFDCPRPRRKSSFLELFSLAEMIPFLGDPAGAQSRFERIRGIYLDLAKAYQATKDENTTIARK